MTEPPGKRIDDLFLAALERPAGERAAFLDEACAGEGALRARVEKLLAAHEAAEKIVPRPSDAAAPIEAPAGEHLIGRTIGQYRMTRILGAGGMGVVYEAEQERPRRQVALKVLRAGVQGEAALRRFEYEAEILARLRHPNIARVYDAGMYDDGIARVPYFAMEYVPDAQTLTDYASEHDLSTSSRLALLIRVCEAVEHAHQQGVIHRDLTPRNILVDAEGEPKIIDFGVARAHGAEMLLTTISTGIGQLIGTIPYMSPEQAGGDPAALDTRSDVYALGVVAYELLGGQLPYELEQALVHEAIRVICEDAPRPLSAINRLFRGDLETIVAKALEKDKTRRYQSPQDFAADVRRFLNDEPIVARPASAAYQLRMFARRNKILVGGVAATLLVLVLGVIGTTVAMVRALDAEALARTRLDEVDAERAEARFHAYASGIAAANAAIELNDVAAARVHLEQAPEEHRNFEWHHLMTRLDQSARVLATGRACYISSAAYGGDFIACTRNQQAEIWDLRIGKRTASLEGHRGAVREPAYSPDGRHVVYQSTDGTAVVWNVETGEIEAELSHRGRTLQDAKFSPDGTLIATAAGAALAHVWHVGRGEEIARLRGHAKLVQGVAFSPDGSRVVTASDDGTLRIWSIETASTEHVLRGHENHVTSVVWSADGTTIVSGSRDGTVRLWEPTGGAARRVLRADGASILSVALSPDGSRLATGAQDRTVCLWDLETGRRLRTFRGSRGRVYAVAFSGDGRRIASADGHALREWDVVAADDITRLRGHAAGTQIAAFAPDSRMIATAGSDTTVRLWDPSSGQEIATLIGHEHVVSRVAFAPDGTRLASGGRGPRIRIWDVAAKREIGALAGFEGRVHAIAFEADGTRILSATGDRTVRRWDPSSGEHEVVLRDVLVGAFGPSRIYAAAFGKDGQAVQIWDLRSGALVRSLPARFAGAPGVAFGPGGRSVGLVSTGQPIRVWELADGREVASIPHTGRLSGLAFAPDGTRLATCSTSGEVRLYDTERWAEVAAFGVDERWLYCVPFSPDGRHLATTGGGLSHVAVMSTDAFAERNEAMRAAIARRTAVAPLVERLFGEDASVEDVVARIQAEETLDDEHRAEALSLAHTRRGAPDALLRWCWETVRVPGHPPEAYVRAHQITSVRFSVLPITGKLTTRGAAEYRLGRYRLAVATLLNAEAFNRTSPSGPNPADLAFLAMAHFRLGQAPAARDTLARLRTLAREPAHAADPVAQALLREAETLIEADGAE